MDKEYKEKLVTKQSIYVDCKWLLRRMYRVRFSVPKRDRAYLFDALIIPTVLSMIGHFRRAYRFREERLNEIDQFLFDFERLKALLDLAAEEKIVREKEYSAVIEYLVRISESIRAWRASARKARTGSASNYGGSPEIDDKSRGGDGFM